MIKKKILHQGKDDIIKRLPNKNASQIASKAQALKIKAALLRVLVMTNGSLKKIK